MANQDNDGQIQSHDSNPSILRTKRGNYKARITRFQTYIDRLPETLSKLQLTEVEVRLTSIEQIKRDFDDVQAILELIALDPEPEYSYRDTFEHVYFSVIAQARQYLDIPGSNVSSSGHTVNDTSVAVNNITIQKQHIPVKLPTISLPQFDGSYTNWLEFRDTYVSLVHDNTYLDNINKFHYLRSALQGSAASIVKSIELTKSNYEVAWKLLLDRYDNSRMLINNHVKALFDVKPMQRESFENLRQLSDMYVKNIHFLKSLGECTEGWNTLLVYLISTKFDQNTLKEWEQHKSTMKNITYELLIDFMKYRSNLLESINSSYNPSTSSYQRYNKPRSLALTEITSDSKYMSNSYQCLMCKSNHSLYNCDDFLKLSPSDRYTKAREFNICLNCLRSGHTVDKCFHGRCKICNKRHNTLLHFNTTPKKGNVGNMSVCKSLEESECVQNIHNSNNIMNASACIGQILLSTALIQVFDSSGRTHVAKALLDSGSTSCFVTKEFSENLKLPTEATINTVSGLNNSVSKINKKCNINFRSLNRQFQATLVCYVLPTITQFLPPHQIKIKDMNIPNDIQLADPEFFKPQQVDILIGGEIFWTLIESGQIKLEHNQPLLQNSKLGWIIAGPIGVIKSKTNDIHCNFATELQQELARFWEIDSVPNVREWNEEEKQCEEHFVKNMKRDPDGRFIVSIPLKESPTVLGESFYKAQQRLFMMERRLDNNPHLKDLYISFMDEYETMNHMTKIDNDTAEIAYYLPHHGVLREHSTTTKLRVVFNASEDTTSGISCNDIQMVGPRVQDDLISILLRFRKYKIAISSDIEKMYRQVLINPAQRCLQRIVWRRNKDERPAIYELNTITYGTASAPFLATRCLNQIGINCEDELLSNIITKDFYVDDLITGADSEEEAIYLCKSLYDELMKAGFPLRKWRSNSTRVLESMSDVNTINSCIIGEAKTLGVFWDSTKDVLTIKAKEFDEEALSKVNKRTILSKVSQIYDPLGIVCPCVITGKIFIQRLWLHKLNWNDPLPKDIESSWIEYAKQLPLLSNINIPRCVVIDQSVIVEHHIFCDASEDAYGACIYVKSIDKLNNVQVKLLCAKTRVAPIKPLTMPRLELCGALIAARLNIKVQESSRGQSIKCIFWTDSTIVIGWLKMQPNKLKTFVRNRVAEIQESTTSSEWRYVSSKENPADILSRGLSPVDLRNSHLWWHGPTFLQQDEINWPVQPVKLPDIPEQTYNVLHVVKNLEAINFNRFSKLIRLKRVYAYVFRFLNNLKGKIKNDGPLSVQELDSTLTYIIKIAQLQEFNDEIMVLKSKNQLPFNSKLLRLSPFIDTNGILRVGGRLSYSDFDYSQKHPILLPKAHNFTKLIFEDYHIKTMHSGPQMLLNTVRQKYWPIDGRNMARKIVHKCVICVRLAAKTMQNPFMASLPRERVQPNLPFNIVGLDYAGPVHIVNKPGRGAKILKCYICLFVCFVTKAIHIELSSDLTAQTFILALKRFIARRGRPTRIYSDNGSNFVGAWNELKDIQNKISEEGITFHFIPPYAAHFGGLWESGVKSIKHHLRRVVGLANLTYEELYTTLVQIEALLNSRPLAPLSTSPDDFSPLTPGHFIIGRPLNALPEFDIVNEPINRLPRYGRVEQLRQHFWKRWNIEYVTHLQQRVKWMSKVNGADVGRMVLIKDINAKPLKWVLGRIVDLSPGKDGVNRVFTVKTAHGIIKRSAASLCPLPDI